MEENTARIDATTLPATVRAAAIVFLVYGVFVVVNATVWQIIGNWVDAVQYPRAFVRLLGMALIAWGLWHRHRWAWWLGIVLTTFWLLAGALALVLLVLSVGQGAPVLVGPVLITVVVANMFLLAGLVLLLLPTTRAAVFLPSARKNV